MAIGPLAAHFYTTGLSQVSKNEFTRFATEAHCLPTFSLAQQVDISADNMGSNVLGATAANSALAHLVDIGKVQKCLGMSASARPGSMTGGGPGRTNLRRSG